MARENGVRRACQPMESVDADYSVFVGGPISA